jgi:hypothetical protein
MLETVDTPIRVVSELRGVTKYGGLVGAASVDYGALSLGARELSGCGAFMKSANSCGGQRTSANRIPAAFFEEARFDRVEAFADYISYGTPDRILAFARDRAARCHSQALHAAVQHHGIAATDELLYLASAWED